MLKGGLVIFRNIHIMLFILLVLACPFSARIRLFIIRTCITFYACGADCG